MKLKLTVSITAFMLTFFVSIYGNILSTSLKRSLFAFILFYIIASIADKLLEREVKQFKEIDLPKENIEIGSPEDLLDGEGQNVNDDFQPMQYDRIRTREKDIAEMDPQMVASLLNNLGDDSSK